MDSSSFDFVDFKRDHAIVEQQHVVGIQIFMQRFECNADTVLIAIHLPKGAVQEKRIAIVKRHTVVRKALDAYLWTLQIAQ